MHAARNPYATRRPRHSEAQLRGDRCRAAEQAIHAPVSSGMLISTARQQHAQQCCSVMSEPEAECSFVPQKLAEGVGQDAPEPGCALGMRAHRCRAAVSSAARMCSRVVAPMT